MDRRKVGLKGWSRVCRHRRRTAVRNRSRVVVAGGGVVGLPLASRGPLRSSSNWSTLQLTDLHTGREIDQRR